MIDVHSMSSCSNKRKCQLSCYNTLSSTLYGKTGRSLKRLICYEKSYTNSVKETKTVIKYTICDGKNVT